MRKSLASLVVAGLGIGTSLPAFAQAVSCIAPSVLPRPRFDGPSKNEPARRIPTASYTLAISWSPQSCRSPGPGDALRCGGKLGAFGFTLHGLWPDGAGKIWPQYCRAAAILPRAIIRQNICVTPSPDLIQHEWAKHGTCMGRDPSAYFAKSRALYQALRYPDMKALSRRRNLTIGGFVDALVAVNPAVPARAVRVTTTKDGWLDELWLCLDKRFRYKTCKANQDGGSPSGRKLRIWRAT